MPQGYFDVVATDALAVFRERAHLRRDETLLDSFPTALLEHHLRPLDRAPVSRLYRNWLSYLRTHKRPASHASTSLPPQRASAPRPAEGVR
jgi:hypothetical protein